MGGMLSMTADCDELETELTLLTEVGVTDPELKMSGTKQMPAYSQAYSYHIHMIACALNNCMMTSTLH